MKTVQCIVLRLTERKKKGQHCIGYYLTCLKAFKATLKLERDTNTLDILFRQITTFMKVCTAFAFGFGL